MLNYIQIKVYVFNRKIFFINDGVFFINTGLDLTGSIYNSHIKSGPTGECRSYLRCLSQFISYQKGKYQLLIVL